MSDKLVTLRIFRYNQETELIRYSNYAVPDEVTTVQRALFYISQNDHDPPAFRPYVCNRGQCACCVLLINGKAKRACATKVKDQMVIEPLFVYPVIRDLVVDFGKRFRSSNGNYYKLMEGTIIRSDYSHSNINKFEGRQAIKYNINNMDKCRNCESKDCINICPINSMENLDDLYGRRLEPKKVTIVEKGGSIELSGFCMQCPNQPCVRICPTNAFKLRKGLVLGINPSLCIGCGICMDACPFNVIWFNIERGFAVKCDLCGGEPKCVSSCSENNLSFDIINL